MIVNTIHLLLLVLLVSCRALASDNRDGTYTNPIIAADYSDPDVIRVGDDFYLTPVIGADPDGNGKGEPVSRYRKPDVGREYPVQAPQTSDEFAVDKLGLQWQWHANPFENWLSVSTRRGWMRLNAISRPAGAQNLWSVPNLLLQKLPAREFTVTTLVDASHLKIGERSGLLMMGRLGLFALAPAGAATHGYADYDWFRFKLLTATMERTIPTRAPIPPPNIMYSKSV